MQMVAAQRCAVLKKLKKPLGLHAYGKRDPQRHSQGATDPTPFAQRNVKRRLLIVIASDKGLAGAYNSNVLKRYLREVKSDREASVTTETITVGRKASQFTAKLAGVEVRGTYDDLPDDLEGSEFHSILATAAELFREGEIDAVDLVYTEFVSSLTQTARVQRLLPAGYTETDVTASTSTALYEPSVEAVLEGVAYRLVGAQIFQTMLDARI